MNKSGFETLGFCAESRFTGLDIRESRRHIIACFSKKNSILHPWKHSWKTPFFRAVFGHVYKNPKCFLVVLGGRQKGEETSACLCSKRQKICFQKSHQIFFKMTIFLVKVVAESHFSRGLRLR